MKRARLVTLDERHYFLTMLGLIESTMGRP
jgi:hypothetical protein